MAKLIFLLDGNVIKEYALDKERMTIGRRSSNDIHIDNLAISGEHAVIVTSEDDTYLEDLNSTNGTLVNEKSVKKHTLKHGDAIGLGKYQLRYVTDATAIRQEANGFADTVMVQSDDNEVAEDAEQGEVLVSQAQEEQQVTADQLEPSDSESASPAISATDEQAEESLTDEAKEQGARLDVLSGDDAGNTIQLDKSMVKVGQPGEQVAVVTKRQEGYFITHVAGDNFPIINGQPVGAQAYALNNHDEIEVLGIKMEFLVN